MFYRFATADPPGMVLAAVGLNTQGLQAWLINNGVTVLVVLIGLALLVKASKGDAGQVLTVVALSLFALGFVAIALIPGGITSVAKWAGSLIGIGGTG